MLLHGFRRYVVRLLEMLAFEIGPHSKESAYDRASAGPCFGIIIARSMEL